MSFFNFCFSLSNDKNSLILKTKIAKIAKFCASMSFILMLNSGYVFGMMADDERSPSDFDTRVARSISLRDEARGRNIVAVVGSEGAGKSTLVNLLARKELRVSHHGTDYLLVDDHDPTAMVIARDSRSELPKFIDIEGVRFFDFPGFRDTDGLDNFSFTRQILFDAATVRFVVVASEDQFTAGHGSSAKKMFRSLQELIKVDQRVNLTDNSIFVLTRTTLSPDMSPCDFLRMKIRSRDTTEFAQQLQFWDQSGRLSRMFHPARDEYNRDIRDDILRRILATTPVQIRDTW